MSTAAASLTAARKSIELLVKSGAFDRVMDKVRIVSAGCGRATAELLVQSEHTNRAGFLHGGMAATLVDSVTTIAMMSDGTEAIVPGVSVDLNVQFMSPGQIGQTLLMEAETLKRGKTMAFLTIDLIEKESRTLIARGTHIKFIGSRNNRL